MLVLTRRSRVVLTGHFDPVPRLESIGHSIKASPLLAHYEARERGGTILEEILPRLSSLRSVHIDIGNVLSPYDHRDNAAVPLSVLIAILVTPQIRHLTVDGYLYHPCSPIPLTITLHGGAPIISFKQSMHSFREDPRAYPSEAALLSILLPKYRRCLDKLEIPAENAPLKEFYKRDWPSLRELTLYGECEITPVPFVSVLARLPQLRSLQLQFAIRTTPLRRAIWPRGFSSSFPWPHLERLYIGNPDPEDELWEH